MIALNSRDWKGQLKDSLGKDLFFQAIVVMLFAGMSAGLYAWVAKGERMFPLDIDGWGVFVGRLKEQGHHVALLFTEPSLHRGPVVPFLFGLTYYLAPFDESVILFSIFAFSMAAGCLFMAFRYLGVNRTSAASVMLLWIVYIYGHKYVFGYYFAEPFLALLSALLFFLAARTISDTKVLPAFLAGLTAGLLLLARSPFILVICTIPLIFCLQSTSQCGRKIALFYLGTLLIFLPWPTRNFLVYKAFVPFTTEAGQVIFQGTYVKGDDDIQNNLRKLPEFVKLERIALKKSEIEQDRYWKGLAIEQIHQDPIGQFRLFTRKLLRFWLYLPAHSWTPSLKTLFFAIVFLPLAIFGAWQGRHSLLVQLCALWVCGLWFFHGIVHAELRYNFPILPMMFILALAGVGFLLEGRFLSQPAKLIRGLFFP